MNKKRRALLLSFIILHSTFCLFLSACGPRRTPDLARIFAASKARTGKAPIIVIPGILGSRLVNRRTGEVVWPTAFRSDVDGLGLPITPDLAANRDNLVPERIVETARLAKYIPEVYVYNQLLDALRSYGGYRDGNWDDPGAEGDHDTMYVFAYDWRRDNVETARALVRKIETLKLKLNRPDLRFNIIAHSMGGLIARYAARYGDADLPAGDAPLAVTWAGARHISKIFMFATPNEGSMDAFATLLVGYSVNEGLRPRLPLFKKLSREGIVTLPALFQLLPHAGAARFLDENLAPLEIDLYDPANWRRYHWSPLTEPDYRARFATGLLHDENVPRHAGDPKVLDAYLEAVLVRARRFHEALDVAPAAASPITLYAFGGDCEETLAAVVITRDPKSGDAATLTSPRTLRTKDGRTLARAEVLRAMYEPGDGRVTRDSLLGIHLGVERRSPLLNTPLPLAYALFICDLHSKLQNNKTLQDNALTLLVNEVMN
ncbi:MAG: lipase/acyltransferase domain-containing protein [Pyrinomonadaceae bacterium]